MRGGLNFDLLLLTTGTIPDDSPSLFRDLFQERQSAGFHMGCSLSFLSNRGPLTFLLKAELLKAPVPEHKETHLDECVLQ